MANNERLISSATLVIKLAKKNRVGMIHYDDVLAVIADVPTVDAVEVVRGRWNEINQMTTGLPWKYRCNKCGCPQDYAHNYCPNCGAKMDGGNEDGNA